MATISIDACLTEVRLSKAAGERVGRVLWNVERRGKTRRRKRKRQRSQRPQLRPANESNEVAHEQRSPAPGVSPLRAERFK